MNLSRNQHSIASVCEVQGRGYWTAKEVCVVMRPAPADTGILLVRSDLPDRPSCPAHVEHRSDATLRTNLSRGNAQFEMIEHLMAALYAMEIDNCIVEINGLEFPGLDGSSKPYIDALCGAGLVIQAAQRPRLVIEQLITLREGESWISASPIQTGVSHFGYQLAFDHKGPIANQNYGFACTPIRFSRDVAGARTFVTQSQAQALHAKGVAKHVSYQDLLVFDDDGPIDNQLRFNNECARHKTLDLVGDLALAGVELVGKFVSYRGGHHLNGRMAKALHELAVQTHAKQRFNLFESRPKAA
ncbi:UDP-3-O-acyl-N-acetylglucosamine deacetylase [Stieleria sp. TO1_6]|uniref:UDP-3-O-acyl-N-acetylglucosamine deacetylase n=1 Tax=Stieleria tagensis TaxID=2956795 RepID=UPI00209AA950|nr:UDP-3-O-acyl-N-acetylglucosamine deacetylase [Stieleria tagensis]MCO8120701.1 UDP-3-O-acyl-N-acetylglucosamine deacetylase [Stieleria tagensis]